MSTADSSNGTAFAMLPNAMPALDALDKTRLHEDLTESAQRIADLVAGFDADQWLGPALPIVNPPLWEVGHVAWFNERWTLRNLYEAASLVDKADERYNSAEVAHDTGFGTFPGGLAASPDGPPIARRASSPYCASSSSGRSSDSPSNSGQWRRCSSMNSRASATAASRVGSSHSA